MREETKKKLVGLIADWDETGERGFGRAADDLRAVLEADEAHDFEANADDEAPPFEPGSILETIATWRQKVKHPDRAAVTMGELERDRIALDLMNILEALVLEAKAHRIAFKDVAKWIGEAAVATAVEKRIAALEGDLFGRVGGLEKKITELEKERWDLSRDFGRMRGDVNALKEAANKLGERAVGLEKRIEALEEDPPADPATRCKHCSQARVEHVAVDLACPNQSGLVEWKYFEAVAS